MIKLTSKVRMIVLLLLSISAYLFPSNAIAFNRSYSGTNNDEAFSLKITQGTDTIVVDTVKTKSTDSSGIPGTIRASAKNKSQNLPDRNKAADSLKNNLKGYPVIGADQDTLFYIYSKTGAAGPQERSVSISSKIKKLGDTEFLNVDSIKAEQSDNTWDILYGETIIMSVSQGDARANGVSMQDLAGKYLQAIRDSVTKAKSQNRLLKLLLRLGLVLIVIVLIWIFTWAVGKGYKWLNGIIDQKKSAWFRDLSYRDYKFLTAEQEKKAAHFIIKILRWVAYAFLAYISLPVLFSIFPFSRNWATILFRLIWSPLKGVLTSVWDYLPNLFSILVIYFVMKYVNRFVKYIFREIQSGNLKISGFYPDWAMPTYSIIRFLLYAFMFVLIFPYLPGSGSDVFKGVSVFIGVLFSLGSSSAIANMVAGLVITYMRPFKIGDRIRIGDVTGDLVEKTLLVTRVRTIKNEIITIPNSSILTGNTMNYSSLAREEGLIIHSSVTIGYDVPWKEMHRALIDAALMTDMIQKDPAPFVLQTSLDDFYVSYQVNAYTTEASKQAVIYSELHQNIQDMCNERGIEIMSPHYRAERDGNRTAIPKQYKTGGEVTEGFRVIVRSEKEK